VVWTVIDSVESGLINGWAHKPSEFMILTGESCWCPEMYLAWCMSWRGWL